VCGFAGVCNLRGEPVADSLLRRMTDVIAHRGPDGEGHYTDGPVGLGHRRLAIIDLSEAGHQPMANETGDVILVYNGEIFNFQALRVQLEALGHRFHSRTDTEVVVHAYEEWGAACVRRFNGMFAFAVWDRVRRRLFLARDRYGVKPLYWYLRDGAFVFASEVKAILVHPRVSPTVSGPALREYFAFQNVFSDLTLFDGIRLLPPGSILTLEVAAGAEPMIERYWDFPTPDESLERADPRELEERLLFLFQQAVTRQLVSDVPVGAYLSGGMDSGSIVAVAVRDVPRLTTFTGGFDLTSASGLELGFDERRDSTSGATPRCWPISSRPNITRSCSTQATWSTCSRS
jgi:asparagine synthase (glutamine-hydrolysing)